MLEELTRLIANKPELIKNLNANLPRLVKLVQYLIDNGVTIPVRCKDCGHYTDGGCKLTYGEYEPNPDDFCSYGERKDND